jgi:hypothetical protein
LALKSPPPRYIAHYNTTTQRLEIILNGKVVKKLRPLELRYSSEELAGDPKSIDPQVFPSSIHPLGQTAFEVNWSDGKKHCHFCFSQMLEASSGSV